MILITSLISLQVINKVGDQPFTKQDEEVFASYLQFCGIGLRNAHLYEKSQLEVKRNQVLLDLARMIFEEQSTIEHVVFRILTHTQSLIQCQRVQVRVRRVNYFRQTEGSVMYGRGNNCIISRCRRVYKHNISLENGYQLRHHHPLTTINRQRKR